MAYSKEYAAEYRRTHRVQILAKQKGWREKHRDRINAAKRKWRAKNHDQWLAAEYVWREKNRERVRKNWREWARKNAERTYYHALKTRFGLTKEQYEVLEHKQNGRCAICGHPPAVKRKRLDIDHDHSSNAVRGLLCHRCNPALGLFGDDIALLRRAIKYLLKPPITGIKVTGSRASNAKDRIRLKPGPRPNWKEQKKVKK